MNKSNKGNTSINNLIVFSAIGATTALILFMLMLPSAASTLPIANQQPAGNSITLQVAIPCPGHAGIITDELRKINGVTNVQFRMPDLFDVNYDPAKASKEQILSLDIFNTYKAEAK